MVKYQYSLGADPELFLCTKENKLKSSIGLIGGSKTNPKIIDDLGLFKIQEDNVAAEYNIPPSFNKKQFVEHILWPQEYISKLIGTKKYKIYKKASAYFPEEELKDPKALEFGCDPDYNAWTLSINEKPYCSNKTFRTAGGHIHFSLPNPDDPWEVIRAIRNMDHYIGVWSVITDTDKERKILYGKAGCFRPQKHGGEYRTLSNFWIFDVKLIEEIWDRAMMALQDNNLIENPKQIEVIQEIINTNDSNAAKQYLKTNGLF